MPILIDDYADPQEPVVTPEQPVAAPVPSQGLLIDDAPAPVEFQGRDRLNKHGFVEDAFRKVQSFGLGLQDTVRLSLLASAGIEEQLRRLPMGELLAGDPEVSRKWAEKASVIEEVEEPDFWDKLARGGGSLTSFMLPGAAIARTPAAAMAVSTALGSLIGAGSTWEDADLLNATEDQKMLSLLGGAAFGATEGLPGVYFLGKLNKATGGRLFREFAKAGVTRTPEGLNKDPGLFKEIVKGFLTEGAQEGFQTWGENFTASKIAGYDPERDNLQGVGEAALIGGILGGGVGGVMQPFQKHWNEKKRNELAEEYSRLRPSAINDLVGSVMALYNMPELNAESQELSRLFNVNADEALRLMEAGQFPQIDSALKIAAGRQEIKPLRAPTENILFSDIEGLLIDPANPPQDRMFLAELDPTTKKLEKENKLPYNSPREVFESTDARTVVATPRYYTDALLGIEEEITQQKALVASIDQIWALEKATGQFTTETVEKRAAAKHELKQKEAAQSAIKARMRGEVALLRRVADYVRKWSEAVDVAQGKEEPTLPGAAQPSQKTRYLISSGIRGTTGEFSEVNSADIITVQDIEKAGVPQEIAWMRVSLSDLLSLMHPIKPGEQKGSKEQIDAAVRALAESVSHELGHAFVDKHMEKMQRALKKYRDTGLASLTPDETDSLKAHLGIMLGYRKYLNEMAAENARLQKYVTSAFGLFTGLANLESSSLTTVPQNLGTHPSVKARPDEWYYSKLYEIAQNAQMKNGTMEQWLNYLRKYGAKNEEIHWTRLGDLLDNLNEEFGQNRRTISKEEIVEYLRDARVYLQELVVDPNIETEASQEVEFLKRRNSEIRQTLVERFFLAVEDDVLGDVLELHRLTPEYEYIDESETNEEVFAELVRTMPHAQYEEMQLLLSELENVDFRLKRAKHNINPEYSYWQVNPTPRTYGTLQIFIPADIVNDTWKAPHFKQNENLLVHARYNIRTDKNGKQYLHIEEIQSDWHQRGRDLGYRPDSREKREYQGDVLDKMREFHAQLPPIIKREVFFWWSDNEVSKPFVGFSVYGGSPYYKGTPYDRTNEPNPGWIPINKEVMDLFIKNETRVFDDEAPEKFRPFSEAEIKILRSLPEKQEEFRKRFEAAIPGDKPSARSLERKPPQAPFKEASDWSMLIMKRLIRMAAERGLDGVSMTTALQQIPRYENELRARVDKVSWRLAQTKNKEEKYKHVDIYLKNGNVLRLIVDSSGKVAAASSFQEKLVNVPLKDILGAGTATEILAKDEESTIQGDKLTIGAKGFIGFYDVIVPGAVNKYLKKYGVKMELKDLAGRVTDPATEFGEQWTFPLTEKMIDDAMRGVPLFSFYKRIKAGKRTIAGLSQGARSYNMGFDEYLAQRFERLEARGVVEGDQVKEVNDLERAMNKTFFSKLRAVAKATEALSNLPTAVQEGFAAPDQPIDQYLRNIVVKSQLRKVLEKSMKQGPVTILDLLDPKKWDKISVPGLDPKEFAGLREHLDRFTRFNYYTLNLLQIPMLNPHWMEGGFGLYHNAVANELQTHTRTIMARADETLKLWRRMGKESANKISNVLQEETLSKEAMTPTQLSKRLTPAEAEVYYQIRQDLAMVLNEMKRISIKAAKTSLVENQEELTKALTEIETHFSRLSTTGYFPLFRFGKYVLTARAQKLMIVDGKPYKAGELVHWEGFDYELERAQMAKRMKQQYPDLDISFRLMTPSGHAYQSMPRPLLIALRQKLAAANGSSKALAELDEAIKNSLPLNSFHRKFLKRKGTAGFSRDFQRSFAQYMATAANHMGRVEAGDAMREGIARVQREVEILGLQGRNADARSRLLEWMQGHYDYTMNPQNEWQGLRSIAFLWHLGMNIKGALVNLFQPLQVALPYFSDKYGDVKALAAMTRASNDVRDYWMNRTVWLQSALKDEQKKFTFAQGVGPGEFVLDDMSNRFDLDDPQGKWYDLSRLKFANTNDPDVGMKLLQARLGQIKRELVPNQMEVQALELAIAAQKQSPGIISRQEYDQLNLSEALPEIQMDGVILDQGNGETILLVPHRLTSKLELSRAMASKRKNAKTDDLKGGMLRMIQRGQSEGWLDQSLAQELAIARSENRADRLAPVHAFQRGMYKTAEILAKPFHTTEKLNRLYTAMVAYRMAKDEGMSDHAAELAARAAVRTTMYEHTNWNRPTFMRGKKSILFVFFNYIQNTVFLATGGNGMAMRMMLMFALMGGLLGLPGAQDAEDLIDFVLTRMKKAAGAKDPKVQIRQEARQLLTDMNINPDLVLHGFAQDSFGLPWAMNFVGFGAPSFDLSGSLGLGNVIPGTGVPEALVERGIDEGLGVAVREIGGAGISVGEGMLRAMLSTDPNDWKRFEKLYPTFAKNVAKAWRYRQEGRETDAAGRLVAEFDPYDTRDNVEMLGQAFGFTPTRITRGWERIRAEQEVIGFYRQWRAQLLKDFSHFVYVEDREAMADARKAIEEFNALVPYPEMGIEGKQLAESATRYIMSQEKHLKGVEETRYYRLLNEIRAGYKSPPDEDNENRAPVGP